LKIESMQASYRRARAANIGQASDLM
jgi:hypothetical protein